MNKPVASLSLWMFCLVVLVVAVVAGVVVKYLVVDNQVRSKDDVTFLKPSFLTPLKKEAVDKVATA